MILSTDEALAVDDVMRLLESADLRVTSRAQAFQRGTISKISLELDWHGPVGDVAPPAAITTIAKLPGVRLARWTPKGMAH